VARDIYFIENIHRESTVVLQWFHTRPSILRLFDCCTSIVVRCSIVAPGHRCTFGIV